MNSFSQRIIWAIFATVLTIFAIVYELQSKICVILFDPLPDIWCVLAYSFVGIMLIFNEYVIHKTLITPISPNVSRNLAYSRIGTAIALVIASIYSILFVPAIPESLIALMFFGVGVGAWSPFINLIVLICQWRTLNKYRTANSPQALQQGKILTGTVAIVIVFYYAIIPLLAGQSVLKVAKHAPTYGMFSTWWEFIHGHYHSDINGTD